MYTIGKTKSLSHEELDTIKNLVPFALPTDYLAFIQEYGFGEVNNLLMFSSPDKLYFINNFADYLDLWDWAQEDDKETALNGLTVSTTIDGDIIICVDNPQLPYLMMPRHATVPEWFDSLNSLFDCYRNRYQLPSLYYSPYFNRKLEVIKLTPDGRKDEELNERIRKSLLDKYIPDVSLNLEVQPKYIYQFIGGWVYFNMWSTIHVCYQTMYQKEADEVINFIKRQKEQ